jgi:septation ring formation regulator EzrA
MLIKEYMKAHKELTNKLYQFQEAMSQIEDAFNETNYPYALLYDECVKIENQIKELENKEVN